MPQFRKLHTKVLDSIDVDSMTCDFVRLTWVLLPLIVCKEGRGLNHAAWLRSNLYPLRDDVTKEMVAEAMREFVDLGMVLTYSVDGREYFQIANWHEYQNTAREADSPYPAPTQELVMSSSGVGKAISSRTSSISISDSMSEGGYGGEQDKADMVTALCNVARGAGVTGRQTLDAADDLLDRGATPDKVLAFGKWWQELGEGKPWVKQVLTFWEDFEAGRVPFFADNGKGSGKRSSAPPVGDLLAILSAGGTVAEMQARIDAAGLTDVVGRMGKLSDIRRMTAKDVEWAYKGALA